jgi:hypothetical protein
MMIAFALLILAMAATSAVQGDLLMIPGEADAALAMLRKMKLTPE